MREFIRLGWFPNMGPKEKFSLQLRLRSKIMAERQGFEPWEALTSTVFKTAAFDHSATSPRKDHFHVLQNLVIAPTENCKPLF